MLGVVAWTAVALIVVVGLVRGLPASDVLLLGTAMAISAIPTGLPTFVQAMLSYGARQLADAKAVVKNLTDVETLGATSAINTDKTGTLTLNQMMVSTLYVDGAWFTVEGEGYAQDRRASCRSAGTPVPDFTRLAYALVLDSDATVGDDGAVIGDPTEAALVVLAAKLGVDADAHPAGLPAAGGGPVRLRLQVHGHVPPGRRSTASSTSSSWSRAARTSSSPGARHAGGPFSARPGARSSRSASRIEAANRRMGGEGAAGARLRRAASSADDELPLMPADPMSLAARPRRSSGWSASSTRCGRRRRRPWRRRCGPASTSA